MQEASASTYSFKSVEGGVGTLGVMALRLTSDIVLEEEASGTLRLNKLPLAHSAEYIALRRLTSASDRPETDAMSCLAPSCARYRPK